MHNARIVDAERYLWAYRRGVLFTSEQMTNTRGKVRKTASKLYDGHSDWMPIVKRFRRHDKSEFLGNMVFIDILGLE